MDELIEDLKATIVKEARTASIDVHKLAALSSSFKDLTLARLLESIRQGKIKITPTDIGGRAWVARVEG
jgi:hypothetical protein